jgi:hypothetical protein
MADEVITPKLVAQQRREIHELHREHVKYIRKTRLVVAFFAAAVALFYTYSSFAHVSVTV